VKTPKKPVNMEGKAGCNCGAKKTPASDAKFLMPEAGGGG